MDEVTAAKSRLKEIDTLVDEIKRKIKALRSHEATLLDEKKTLEELVKCNIICHDGEEFKSNSFPWSKKIANIALETFKIEKFRGMQEAAINCILSGKDCILIMPTGGGKSLTYQLPCFYLQGLTVVVTPLVSLMEDQVMQVLSRCSSFPVACLHSQLSREQSSAILKRMLFPNKDETSLLLYVTPERLAKSKMFMTKLQKCWEMKMLKLLAIDEVHCCSQWGHDFRPDYNYLGILKKQFPGIPLIGLTATASKTIVSDVVSMLSLDDDVVILRDAFDRPNLRYKVQYAKSDIIETIGNLICRTYKAQTGIVYCFSIREAEEVAKRLVSDFGISAHPYHASLEPEFRSKVHKRWSAGKVQVIVATVAFGMGIDKPDVRFVIHFSIAKSMENYYQESGRAGRDGKPADCLVFLKFQDIFRLSSMVFSEKTGVKNLYQVVDYCLERSTCRRTLLARHFSDNQAGLSTICKEENQKCDNCSSSNKKEFPSFDISRHIKLMSEAIEEAQAVEVRLTGNKLVDVIRKKDKTYSKDEVEQLVAWCLCKGYLEEKYHFTPYSTIPFFAPGVFMSDVVSGSEKAIIPGGILQNRLAETSKGAMKRKHSDD